MLASMTLDGVERAVENELRSRGFGAASLDEKSLRGFNARVRAIAYR